MMGASNPHPHCQIWATSSIPNAPSKELADAAGLLAFVAPLSSVDYIALEQRQQIRIIF